MTADIAPVDRFLDAVWSATLVTCSRCLADGVVFKALLPDAHHDVSSAPRGRLAAHALVRRRA